MSIAYLNLAFTAPLSGATKSVLIAIADRANDNGFCYPSLMDIAHRAGISKRTVIRAVEKLSALGFLEKISEKGRVNGYFLRFDLSTTGDNVSPVDTYPQVPPGHQVVTPCQRTSDMRSPEPLRTIINQRNARTRDNVTRPKDWTDSPSFRLYTPQPMPKQNQRRLRHKSARSVRS